MAAPQYVPTKFGSFSAKRFRRPRLWIGLASLTVVMIGAVVMAPFGAPVSDAAVALAARTNAEIIPKTTLAGYAAADPTIVNGTHVLAEKPFCVGGRPTDANCVAFQPPKVRMVRVPRVASVGQQGNPAKSGVAAGPRSPGLNQAMAEPKKAHRLVHHQNQRGTQSRREARHPDSARQWNRGEDRPQGFARSFW